MRRTPKLSLTPPRWWKSALGGLVGLAWLAFVVLAVVPIVRSTLSGRRELDETVRRIVALDGWTGPRLVLARDLAANGSDYEAAWSRMFPAERGRERLFLELARIADASGVREFDLAEVVDPDAADDGDPDEDVYEDEFEDDVGGADPIDASAVALDSYRVRASWSGDYRRTADFIARLRGIARAVSVSDLQVSPYLDGIRVELELEVFVDGATES